MKTILITGASGALGSVVTGQFLQKGYQVIAPLHSEKGIDALPKHANLHTAIIDLANEAATNSLIENLVEQYRTIEVGILLAGGFAGGDIRTTNLAAIHQQVAINFETAYTVLRPLFVHMLQNKQGRIVLTGSQVSLTPKKGKTSLAYSLSKSLLFHLAEILNEEAKGTNVVTTVVVPSTIDTEANRTAMPGSDFTKWVQPGHLAQILEFIVSEKADALREPVFKVYNQAG